MPIPDGHVHDVIAVSIMAELQHRENNHVAALEKAEKISWTQHTAPVMQQTGVN